MHLPIPSRERLIDATLAQEDFGLSQAKKYALKKDVAMKKAALIRAEREQKQQ
jgi:hypothetical protein